MKTLAALESERGALGASMLDRNACSTMLLSLKESDFYSVAHKKIYRAIKELYDKQSPVEVTTVSELLEMWDELKNIGGRVYLVELLNSTLAPSHIMHYVQEIRKMSQRRELVKILEHWIYRAKEDLTDDTIIEQLESDVIRLLMNSKSDEPCDLKSLLPDYICRLSELQTGKKLLGYSWGWVSLDRFLDPICPGDLIVIAGYTSMGKSAFALNVAINLARHSVKVGIISMEDSVSRILNRLLAIYLKIENSVIRRAKLMKEQWEAIISDALPYLSKLPLYIQRCYDMDAVKIKATIRQMVSKNGINVVIIDYLGMIKVDKKSKDTKAQLIGEITKSLKNIAIELNIAILLIAQLHEGANRETRYVRPRVSDLRDSGEIGQDADIVLFVSRPEVLQFPIIETTKGEKVSTKNYAEIIIGKQRDGVTGVIEMSFLPEYLTFTERSEEEVNLMNERARSATGG